MTSYEVEFEWHGSKSREPISEYGFGTNPPAFYQAKNKVALKKMLKLPKTVKIRTIKRVQDLFNMRR